MMKRDLGVGAALGIAFAILLAVNLMASIVLRNAKLDLTDDKLYTLSPGSKSMLKKLDDEVRVKIFYSKRAASGLPSVKQYADRVIELMRQFQANSGGKLRVTLMDPRPDTEVEESAVKYGIKSVPLAGGEPLYFGLVAESETGAERSIPFLDPQREGYLEYDIASLVSAASHPAKKKVGIMSSLNIMGGVGNDPMARLQGREPSPPWIFVNELRQSYNVEEVKTSASEIDKSIDLLLVIHPKKLPEQAEYAIDQYLVNGGKAIIMVDPHCEVDMVNFRSPNPQQRFQETFDSSLPRLMKEWGIAMDAGKALADLKFGTQVQLQGGVEKFPHWLTLGPDNCNKAEIIASGLEKVQFPSSGGLRKAADSKYEVVPLISAPASAGEVDSFMLKLGPSPKDLQKNLVSMNLELPIAAKITGKFKTAFPEGKPASTLPQEPGQGAENEEKKQEENKAHKAEADAPTTLILIGDADFCADDFSVRVQNFFGQRMAQTINDNLPFINNAVEMMTGSQDLISLRTRGKSARPFTKVDELEANAQQHWKNEEESLQAKLEETNKRLRELQAGRDESGKAILSQEQIQEIDKANKEIAENKKKLREVRRNLRQDIERLGSVLQFINIGLMPILVVIFSFFPSAWRSYKMRSNRD